MEIIIEQFNKWNINIYKNKLAYTNTFREQLQKVTKLQISRKKKKIKHFCFQLQLKHNSKL